MTIKDASPWSGYRSARGPEHLLTPQVFFAGPLEQ